MINNKNVRQVSICQRRDRQGVFRQTLVVKTDLSLPETSDGTETMPDYRKLVRDLRGMQELADLGCVGFEKIEIQGPSWRAAI